MPSELTPENITTPAQLVAWIQQQLANTNATSFRAPDPKLLSAYPPQAVSMMLDMSVREFDAQTELRRKYLELAQELAHQDIRRRELHHEQVLRRLRTAERRHEAHAKLQLSAARSTAECLADRLRRAVHITLSSLIAATIIGVFASPWVGGGIAIASLATWLIHQRAVHRHDPAHALSALATSPTPPALPPFADHDEAHDSSFHLD